MTRYEAKILIVDDHEANLLALEAALTGVDATLVRAQSGEQALRCLLDGDFAAILLDVQMPEMDGFETAERIRLRDKSKHTPIVFITAAGRTDTDVAKGYSVGAVDYVIKPVDAKILRAKVEFILKLFQEREEQKSLTAALAERAEMIENQTRDLYRTNERLSRVLETVQGALFVSDIEGNIVMMNASAVDLLGCKKQDLEGTFFVERLLSGSDEVPSDFLNHRHDHIEIAISAHDGTSIPVLMSSNPMRDEVGKVDGFVSIAIDLRQRQALEMELRQSQKLRSIGELAAGIAHEINTPLQFVGDSAQFLEEAWDDIGLILDSAEGLRAAVRDGIDTQPALSKLDAAVEVADLEFLREEVPNSVQRTLEGVSQVAKLVGAMKVFSHRGRTDKAEANLNEAIENTLIVARNEYKYLAKLELDLGEIPLVYCAVGNINQVILNIVVNAAHAIESHRNGENGKIIVKTYTDDSSVTIAIEDNGGGIPNEIKDRIFDPFFTTKDVGRGTGQGLAIARNVIVDKHKGSLKLETTPGVGSKFIIKLPISSGDV
jgi:two-component system NtrC family sensor kinase